ncbi:poly [ADP-ribose] polymerase tankyrase-2-like [Penaeus japonicus]|uniref:poly [ADP-ribose] polymerase tankyrase-2-like n=1 Tax=Penaeus japonicus TaxID=27405 RepID=UPI001C71163C|nr:poly [ADP-ribose] polymerase tankyrase-2-like [Penaeus japonicus]
MARVNNGPPTTSYDYLRHLHDLDNPCDDYDTTLEAYKRSRARPGYSVPREPTPEERLERLNTAIQAITFDDVRTVVSCIPGNIEVGAMYDLVLGANQNKPRRVKASLLHLAVHHRAAQCAKLLLHLGAPTEAADSDLGDCAIHAGVRMSRYDLVTLLLEYGASPMSTNAANDTPLHLAAKQGLVHTCMALLNAGAEPTAKNRYSETPWDTATLAGSPSSLACADLILTHHLQAQDKERSMRQMNSRPW